MQNQKGHTQAFKEYELYFLFIIIFNDIINLNE